MQNLVGSGFKAEGRVNASWGKKELHTKNGGGVRVQGPSE